MSTDFTSNERNLRIVALNLYRSLERLHLAIKECAGIGFEESSPTKNAWHYAVWTNLNDAQRDAEVKLRGYTQFVTGGSAPETFDGWQPIETAPTDGSEFIAFHKEAGVCACFRTGPTSAWYCMDGWNTYTRADGTERPGLTSFVEPPECWQPMPKPPGSPLKAKG